jgi:hypothetical protein
MEASCSDSRRADACLSTLTQLASPSNLSQYIGALPDFPVFHNSGKHKRQVYRPKGFVIGIQYVLLPSCL